MSRLRTPVSNKSQQNSFLLSTPIGYFFGQIENGALISLCWQKTKPTEVPEEESEIAQYIRQSLESYFTGKKTTWDFTYLLPGSPEEKKVYTTLMKIPYGHTLTYSEVAMLVNKPRTARWVGHVLSKNPLPIVIPCHRVVRKDKTGEYSAGGPTSKSWLIQWEKQQVSEERTPPSW
ncbi:methylated-DNA--[protein]-cysteine S-methyltransferase [bacterium]|nr:methylated-DNA--[protein]-cysteine S-methyltransferase [bacterium]